MTPHRLRLHLSLIVTLAGLAAFLSSVLALSLGLSSLTVRYPLAVLCGYATFVLLIRAWIALHRRATARAPSGRSSSFDKRDLLDMAPDLLDVRVPTRSPSSGDIAFFAGGRSGGAGAGSSFSGSSSAIDLDVDVDDLWPLVLAVVCVLGGVIAIGYVIYSAPVLLADVAVDAAIMSGLYRRLKKRDPSHWAMTVVRHTAIPAIVLLIFAGLAGFAAQRIAPEARSIGGVIRSLSE